MHCQCWEYCECESHISIDKWQKYDINLGLGFQVDFFDSFFLKHFQQKTTKKKAWTKQITYLSVFTGCDLSQYYDPLILMLEIKSQDVFIDRGEEANWMKRTTCYCAQPNNNYKLCSRKPDNVYVAWYGVYLLR